MPRAFFAIWPEADVRVALEAEAQRLHRRHGGRLTRPETIHLTLVFLGEVTPEQLAALQHAARAVQVPAFELVFDRAHCWRHNRIAHLSASQMPDAMLPLLEGLKQLAQAQGVQVERRAYVPHITLVRHADCARPASAIELATASAIAPATVSIRLPAREFVLVESILTPAGPRYRKVERYPLS